ncbi:uncharacterized protein LOC143281437 [Babylonia areolata]|uniref:uncharacterized protein LOC143281437 n=1 Tax=Babylonia areolata TaxID=304850 RepID=UPI003FD60048
MDFENEDMEEVTEEMVVDDIVLLSAADRVGLADMYCSIVSGDKNWKACLDSHQHLLDVEFHIEHTMSCSCGRFFEQHPTTIDGTEGELLERMLKQIQTGKCWCLINSDPGSSLTLAARPATKTLLHAAAASGYKSTEIVEYLLSKNCSVNRMTRIFCYTPLFRAVCSKNKEVVSLLLGQEDVDVNLRSKAEQHTPLLEAIFNRHYPIINLLLAASTTNLNVRNFRNETPIIAAARMGELAVLEQLLKMGADPDSRDHRGMTALMFSVMYGMKKVTRLLLSYGANLNLRSTMGETPLLMAISSDSLEVAKILLEAGANVNDVSDDGYPALMVAAYSNFTNIVRLLLSYGVDVHMSNPMGYQAMHIAAWNGYLTIVHLLLEAGAVPDVRTDDLNTPLSLAAHGNFSQLVEVLLSQGCNVNNADKDLDTPLHYATFNGNLACMEKLLEHGANPHARNRLDVTPLWNCVYRGHLPAVKLLLKKNVALSVASRGIQQHSQSDEVEMVFDDPHTPLWLACNLGHVDITMLLIFAGCDLVRETWIARSEFPGKCEESEELKEVLRFYHSTPRALLSQCRIVLRRMAGSDVRRFVRHLPVPQRLKNFILLSEASD